MLVLALLGQLVLQASDLPAAYLESSRSLAEDSVVSGFCYSIGWEPDPSANVYFERELDALSTASNVAPGLARETLTAQAVSFSQGLRTRMVRAPRDDSDRLEILNALDAWARENCASVAQRRPELFKGDVATNQGRVDQNLVIMRRQIPAPAAP